MLKPMIGRILTAQAVFDLAWDRARGVFILSAHEGSGKVRQPLTPDELADLSRELLRASVTKGEDA